jgi:Protein of unknown function (DUF2946)
MIGGRNEGAAGGDRRGAPGGSTSLVGRNAAGRHALVVGIFRCYGVVARQEGPARTAALHKYFANKPLRRRIFALATAYAIVLSSLFANIGAVRAATGAPLDPWSVICHAPGAAGHLPGNEGNSRTCINGCCVGCLMLLATVPPPSAVVVAVARTSAHILKPLPVTVLVRRPERKSHLTRGPPLHA